MATPTGGPSFYRDVNACTLVNGSTTINCYAIGSISEQRSDVQLSGMNNNTIFPVASHNVTQSLNITINTDDFNAAQLLDTMANQNLLWVLTFVCLPVSINQVTATPQTAATHVFHTVILDGVSQNANAKALHTYSIRGHCIAYMPSSGTESDPHTVSYA